MRGATLGISCAIMMAVSQAAVLTPAADAIDIADAANAQELAGRRLALLVGSEGAGLDDQTLARADLRVAIRMAPGVDSLNVATATGIALHRLAPLA